MDMLELCAELKKHADQKAEIVHRSRRWCPDGFEHDWSGRAGVVGARPVWSAVVRIQD